MKIKHMMAVLFLVLSAVPLVGLGVSNMLYGNDKIVRVLENDLRNAVTTQVKAIENFYEERATDMHVIAGTRPVQELLKAAAAGQDTAQLRASTQDLLRSRVQESRFVESITLTDAAFCIIACSEETAVGERCPLSGPQNLGAGVCFTSVVETGRPAPRDRVIAAVQQIGTGARGGHLVMELNLAFFEEVRVSASLFNNGTIYLVDGKGKLIVAGDSQSPRNHYELAPSEREDYLRALGARDPGSSLSILRYEARGQHYLSCYAGFVSTDWHMISSINTDEVLEIRRGWIGLGLFITAVLLLVLLAVQSVLARFLGAPMRRMIEKFDEVRRTHDYTVRMDADGGSEIGVIAREVNALLASVESYVQLERHKLRELEEKAQRDALTGLYNQGAVEQLLRLQLDAAWAKGEPLACLFLDVDDFKDFNTRYGHSGGDRVLRFIAEALRRHIPGLAGRQGGDEFVACMAAPGGAADVKRVLDGLLGTLGEGVTPEEGGEAVPVRCSIGAVLTEGAHVGYETLIAYADEVMYEVKHGGKNGYAVRTLPAVKTN